MFTVCVLQLWCPDQAGTVSVLQKTYAHEKFPHALVTELVLNNTAGLSSLSVPVHPAALQPKQSVVGPADKSGKRTKCMVWSTSALSATHSLSTGVISEPNKKGRNITVSVAAPTAGKVLSAPAGGFSAALVLVTSRYSSAETTDATSAASEAILLNKNSSSLWDSHLVQYRARGRNAAPISVSSPELALLMNASWYALGGTAPRPEQELNGFGTGISSLNTNGYNGRTFWDMDTWVSTNSHALPVCVCL